MPGAGNGKKLAERGNAGSGPGWQDCPIRQQTGYQNLEDKKPVDPRTASTRFSLADQKPITGTAVC